MSYPARIHEYSSRVWTGKVAPAEYDSDMIVKKVCKNGAIRELGNRVWEVFYRDYSLGYFVEGEGKYYSLE